MAFRGIFVVQGVKIAISTVLLSVICAFVALVSSDEVCQQDGTETGQHRQLCVNNILFVAKTIVICSEIIHCT